MNELENSTLKVLPILTDRQAECLIYIFEYFVRHRFYPTQREIAQEMKLRTNSAETHIVPLIKKGYITKELGQRRNLRLTPAALQKLELMGKATGEQLVLFEKT